MDRKTRLVLYATYLLLKKKQQEERKEERRRLWSRNWLLRRNEESLAFRLMRELRDEDPATLKNWIRLDQTQFQELLDLISPLITMQDTNYREAVSPHERLLITLCYLASGETYRSLSRQFRVSHNLISTIIPTVCKAIYEVLQPKYLQTPSTADEWNKIAKEFYDQWNFPNCCGALDGKRIRIKKPINSGSSHYDYKTNNSIILLALVDANYKFLYVDVGACGRASDGGVWDRCTLKEAVEASTLGIPEATNIPFSNKHCPFLFVGDDAFPLTSYIMKPYPGRGQTPGMIIFNYRLSRARRTSENAFGILATRFQVYQIAIRVSPETVTDITLATIALHNMLMETSRESYSPPELVDREDVEIGIFDQGDMHLHPHAALEPLHRVGRRPANVAKELRDKLKDYFNNEGQVPWQERMALSH